MKKIFVTAAIIFGCMFFKLADAQVHVSLGVNIGSQPDWGPAGYDHASYYYMPDIDAYYDVPARTYVYYDNNVWVHSAGLPPRYQNYDVYHGYKVVVNHSNPWLRNDYYRTHYAADRGRRDQVIIRDRRVVNREVVNRRVINENHNEGGHWDNGNHGGRGPEYHEHGGGGKHGDGDKHGDEGHGGGHEGHGKH